MAQASAESARLMESLGRDQMAFAKQQHAEMFPIVKDIAGRQMETMEQTAAQGKEYYDYMKETFRPVEESLVADVTEYNTEAEQERQAAAAAADIEQADTIARESESRAMARMGVNPSAGRFQSMSRRRGLQKAGMKGRAKTIARNRARDIGYARKLDVTGMGRGLPGASTAAYGTSTAAGTSAARNIQQPGSQYQSGMAQGVSTIGAGQRMNLSGRQAILSGQIAAGRDDSLGEAIGGIAQGVGYFF